MEETVDEIMAVVERELDDRDIELSVAELDEIRDTLDDVLLKYDEKE